MTRAGNYQIIIDGVLPLFQLKIFTENQALVGKHWHPHVALFLSSVTVIEVMELKVRLDILICIEHLCF